MSANVAIVGEAGAVGQEFLTVLAQRRLPIIMNVAVWPLYKVNRVRRIIVSTYQAVSGAGAQGLYDLEQQIKAYAGGQPITKHLFPHQIVNNLFSHNTKIDETGYNEEEL